MQINIRVFSGYRDPHAVTTTATTNRRQLRLWKSGLFEVLANPRTSLI
jgi:hypothetical protein